MAAKATSYAWYTLRFLLVDRSFCRALALFASCLGWFLMFETSAAQAEERGGAPREIVHVQPGTPCIDASQLVEQVELWLAGDAVDRALTVDVAGGDRDASWVAFTLRRGPTVIARRRFEPLPVSTSTSEVGALPHCDAVAATLSLSIALALKVSLIEQFVPTRATAPAPRPEPRPVASTPRVRSPWAIALPLRLTRGLTPSDALGAALTTTRLFARRLGVQLDIEGLRSRRATSVAARARPPVTGSDHATLDAWISDARETSLDWYPSSA